MTIYELITLLIIAIGVLVDLIACVVSILSFLKSRKNKE